MNCLKSLIIMIILYPKHKFMSGIDDKEDVNNDDEYPGRLSEQPFTVKTTIRYILTDKNWSYERLISVIVAIN